MFFDRFHGAYKKSCLVIFNANLSHNANCKKYLIDENSQDVFTQIFERKVLQLINQQSPSLGKLLN